MGSQESYYKELDTDRADGCIRDYDHAYNKDGGLAVLYGNIARNGCIVKTAGVDPSVYHFKGTAKVFQSQDDACNGILGDKVQAGDVVVIRYEGPKGGPGMQEMLYPTSYIKSMNLGKGLCVNYRRPFFGRNIWIVHWAYFSGSCGWRRNRTDPRWRFD